jgi:hypothetical protein
MRKRIRFRKWRSTSGQKELENQKFIRHPYTQIDWFSSIHKKGTLTLFLHLHSNILTLENAAC